MQILEVGAGSSLGHQRHFGCSKQALYSDVRITDLNRNFIHVCCDGQYLPFQNGSFEMVYSRLVIEYVKDPVLFFKELLRVAKKQVTVICWHRLSRIKSPKGVKHKFSPEWFRELLKNFNHEIKVEYGWLRINTNMPIPFLMSSKFIIVKVWKQR